MAEAAAAKLLAEEEAEKAAVTARQTNNQKKKQKQKANKGAALSPMTQSSARAVGLGDEEAEDPSLRCPRRQRRRG